ncbi:MAG: Bug family tripartite tricarboxylate transporter substrate binding protein [Burkholderiales bacterium]
MSWRSLEYFGTGLGRPVVVEIRASASQITGVVAVAPAAPDGYTILSHSKDFKQRTGTDMLHVPYKGGAQVIPDLVSGRVQLTFFNLVEQLVSQVRAGKLRALAVFGDKRLADFPDVPTFEESGIRNFDSHSYTAASAPAGTPTEIVERLNREIVRVVREPDVVKSYARLNLTPSPMTTGEMAKMIANDIQSRGPMLKGLGVTLD